MQEDVCGIMNVAILEITKEETLKGTVIPDSYDDFPSQIYVGQERIQAKLPPLMSTFNENRNEHITTTSDENTCLPLVNLSEPVDFEHLHSFNKENGITVSQEIGLNFERKNQDLSSPTKIAPDFQLNNVVIPDSCDIGSQDLSLPTTKISLEVQLKNTVVPDSYDIKNGSLLLNEAHLITQGAVVHSQNVLEQASTEFSKFDNLHSPSAKEESQSSEGNTQKGESDSLGQELTKSMISLLLPQALQILNKKGRKRKKPTTSTMNEVELVDFSDVALEPTAVDEKEPCYKSNEVKWEILEVQNSHSICNEEQGGSVVEDDGICAGKEKNQLYGVKVEESNQHLNADNGVHRAGLETSHKEHLTDKRTKIDQCKPHNLSCCGETFIDNEPVHQQQAPKDSSHSPMSCTAISSDKPTTVDSAPTEFLNKEQVYYANDRQDVSSLSITLKSAFPEKEERRLADHNCEETCSPLSASLKIMETKDSVVEGPQTELEKGTPLKVKSSSTEFVTEHILGLYANATMEGVSKPITGEELSAVSEVMINDKVQPMHSVNSTAMMGRLGFQKTSTVIDKTKDFSHDFCIEQRPADATVREAKENVLKGGAFVPRIFLEHPMPVLAMKITVQDDQARLLVCCGFRDARRLLLLYQMTGNELLPSLISSTSFDILDCDSNALSRGLVESNGIEFTPSGQELLLLGMFKIRETTEEKQALPLDKKVNCLCDIQLVSYTVGKLCIASRLSSFGSQLYCVLPVNTCTVIAGGENGLVTGWIMDTSWRSCKESFTLPLPSIDGGSSSHIIRLSGVSTLPSIVVGCDGQGSIAIWNFVSRQLLRSSKLSMELPLELHILKMDLVGQSNCVESDWTEGRSSFTQQVAASFLVGTLNHQGVGPQDSARQCVSNSWSLKLLKKDNTSAMFNLDQLHQRICTVEVSERLGLAGTNDGSVLFWDTLSGAVMGTLRQLKDEPIKCIARDRACNIIAAAGSAHVMIYAKET